MLFLASIGAVALAWVWYLVGIMTILWIEERYQQKRYVPLLHSPHKWTIILALTFWPLLAAFMIWNRK